MSRRDQRRQVRSHLRMGLVLAVPGLICGLVMAKSVQLQVFLRPQLEAEARKQQAGHTRREGRRGAIYDRNLEVLAGSAPTESVWADPSLVEEPSRTSSELAKVLGLNRRATRALKRRLSNPNKRFIWVKRHSSAEQSATIRGLGLPGVSLRQENKRYWPLRETAGQILGLANLDGDGLEGLEGQWNETLSGKPVVLEGYRDARRQLLLASEAASTEVEGSSLVLTLDKNIQHTLELELEQAVKTHQARGGVAIAMDPRNGDLLGVAHVPRFNPNGSVRDPRLYRNRAFTDVFEPGSTLKVFTVAGALDSDLVSLSSRLDCENGRYRIGRHWIHDHNGHKELSVAEILEVSSNIGTAKIAEKLGREGLWKVLKSYGFGARTGSGVAGEAVGIMHAWHRWSEVQLATVGYGHGIGVTAIQLVTAMAAIANGGELPRPRLVARIVGPDGETVEEIAPAVQRRIGTTKNHTALVDALVQVVEGKDGTGKAARVPGFRVAGKTATAQKVDSIAGGYVDRWIGSFLGFAPATNPRVVLLVSIDEPKDDHYGGIVAAPAFSKMTQSILTYLEVPPQLPSPSSADSSAQATAKETTKKKPSREQTQKAPRPNEPVGAELQRIPDFTGMTLRQALVEATRRNIRLLPQGGGRAIRQSLPPGTSITKRRTCQVEFSSIL